MASITDSTLKQYSSGLKAWWEFCLSDNLDPFNPSVESVLKFLTCQFNKGLSYSSLNTYRSAVAQIAKPGLANDSRLKRFFKGVYSLRPSLPKYTDTWDPTIVLEYVKKLDNDKVGLEELTQKLVILMALATGQRAQTISLVQLADIIQYDDRIEIKVPRRIKTSSRNRPQPTLILPYFNDKNICVARTLNIYISKTEILRSSASNNLFITAKKPHKNASSQTICRWLKNILGKSGLDTSKFTAHSTRHAATSAAFRKGVNIEQIRLAAGWTEKSKTFARFYNQPLVKTKNTFASTVLSLEK